MQPVEKLISITLSIAIAVSSCSTNMYAFTPTDYDNPKCIDIRDLGAKTDYITKENKVCGCKTCSIDAVMFNRLGDYLTDLENRFENLSKEENYLENNVKLKNIESILKDIFREIKYKSYKNMNFVLTSLNNDINEPMAVAQFAKEDGLTYKDDYDDTYFNKINDRVKIVLDKVENYNKLLKDKPIAFNHSEQFKEVAIMLLTSLVGGAVIAFTIMFGPSITSRISKFFVKKQTDEIKKSPEKRAEKLEISSVSST